MECLKAILDKDPREGPGASMIHADHKTNIKTVTDQLLQMLNKIIKGGVENEVSQIVKVASELALKMSAQRSRVEFFRIKTGRSISKAPSGSIDDLNGYNGARNTVGIVRLSKSPGIRRLGDERGGSLAEIRFIYPAKVFLERGD